MSNETTDPLIIDYGFDGLAYTYCPLTDDTCDHDECVSDKRCRKESNDGQS